MNKKNILKTIDNSAYVSLLAGAILVLVFEFTAVTILLKLAIILFGASFLMLSVLCGMKLYYLINQVKEGDKLLVDQAKESKPWLIVRLVISVILFVLMVTYFCLF